MEQTNKISFQKENSDTKKKKLEDLIFQLKQLSEERERELQELNRIAKTLTEREMELAEIKEKREEELEELRKKTKELEQAKLALMNILEDVEEARQKAEIEKNKTLAIIQNFADGLLVFDKENKLTLVNPEAERIFNIKKEDLIGKDIFQLAKIPQIGSLIEILGDFDKKVSRKEWSPKKDLVLEVSLVPISSNKKKMGSLVILHDISREKKIEELKSEFVSIAAHQLRTPLSAIKWTLKMLLDGDLGEITPEQKNFIEKTYQANERMIHLINDLLDVSRIEEGRYVYKPTLIRLDTIVEKMVNSYKELAENKGLVLELKVENGSFLVKVDVEKIKLAIQNLLENAISYTPKGGRVTVSLKERENEIEFSIKDTGVGIPKDQQKRIFSKFFRAPNVMRMQTEGTGLGLFITKNIIESHGGKIWFESEEGKGTTFYFTLPLAKNVSEAPKKVKE